MHADSRLLELRSISLLPSLVPLDLTGALCAFDIDGTLIQPDLSNLTACVAVEPSTAHVLRTLAARGASVVCITARVPGPRTGEELDQAELGFLSTLPRPLSFAEGAVVGQSESSAVCFTGGILFCSNSALLESEAANPRGVTPALLVYLDDAVSVCGNVMLAAERLRIRAMVYRYFAPGREEYFEY